MIQRLSSNHRGQWHQGIQTGFVLCLFVSIAALCSSCGKQSPAATDSQKVTWVDPSTLKAGPVRHSSLSDEQVKRITAVQQIFADVDPTSLENWIQDFKRDMNPDRELAVWESMAAAYSRYNSEKKLSQPERKELYGILLTGSGASVDEAIKHLKLKVFTEADARNALRILSEEWSKHRQ